MLDFAVLAIFPGLMVFAAISDMLTICLLYTSDAADE